MKRIPSGALVLLLLLITAALASLSCSSSSSGPSETPDPPTASIDSPADDAVIVEGGTVNFQGSATGGQEPYTYSWDFGGGATNSTDEDPGDVVFSSAGTYTVTLTVTGDNGDDDTDTVTVTVTATVAYYPFNDNANDESGNGNDATVHGPAMVADRFGNDDSAYFFNGIGDYIQTPVDSNTLPISFSVWFAASSVSGERSIVDSDVFGLGGHSLIIGWWGGDGDLHVQNHSVSADSDFPVSVDTWYHAVVCYSDSIWLYVDGARVAAWEYPTATLDGDLFRFGRHNAADPQWYAGLIDDVRFYNRVLTPDDVLALYHEGGWPDP
jgi:PKD repeat protein